MTVTVALQRVALVPRHSRTVANVNISIQNNSTAFVNIYHHNGVAADGLYDRRRLCSYHSTRSCQIDGQEAKLSLG